MQKPEGLKCGSKESIVDGRIRIHHEDNEESQKAVFFLSVTTTVPPFFHCLNLNPQKIRKGSRCVDIGAGAGGAFQHTFVWEGNAIVGMWPLAVVEHNPRMYLQWALC